jgi:hypothetical protein
MLEGLKVTILYVGSSLLGPLRAAEGEINRRHRAGLRVAAHNLGAPLSQREWAEVERDLSESEVVFVIHVTDGENASRLIPLLKRFEGPSRAVVVINCMPELMRRTRMGKLRFGGAESEESEGSGEGVESLAKAEGRVRRLAKTVASWMSEQARAPFFAGRRAFKAHAVFKARRADARAAQAGAGCGAAARREALPLSLLLLPTADARERLFDAALRAEALRV